MAKQKHTIEKLKEQVFESKHYGKFIVLSEEPRRETSPSERRIKIKFLNTGNEKVVQLDNALAKNVRDSGNPDPTTPRIYKLDPLDFDKEYQTISSGIAKIVKDYGYAYPGRPKERMVRVKFVGTGFEKDVALRGLQTGYIRDNLAPFNSFMNQPVVLNDTILHYMFKHKWRSMIDRCKVTSRDDYGIYGGAGITVCDRWQNFDNYVQDIKSMHGYQLFLTNPNLYQIDKDYLQIPKPKNTYMYSPETCVWLDRYSNDTILSRMNPTEYNGVMYNNLGFFALIYNANFCNLLSYGPFVDAESAARFFLSRPHLIEILNKLPVAKIPTPGPIVFKQLTPMYYIV